MSRLESEVLLKTLLDKLEINLSDDQEEKILRYAVLLIEGLQRQRLTGEKTVQEVLEKQIYDSLYLLKINKFFPNTTMVDLGTGGGLPGVPLKICLPEVSLYLLDSNRRKIKFLQSVSENIGLENIYFMTGRAEEWGQDKQYREKFDYVVVKAVAEMVVLAELALPLIKVGGTLLLYKGPRGVEEAANARHAFAVCGGLFENVWNYKLSTGEKRAIYSFNKVRETPANYPRRTGEPARKPIRGKIF